MVPLDEAVVLVVDDDSAIRQAVRLSLMGSPYRVLEAGSLVGLPSLVAREMPDVLLLDVHFRGEGTSLDTLGEIHAAHPALPVIVISGAASSGEAAQAMRRGARDFLEKPLSEERLRVALEHALEHARLTSVVRSFQRPGSLEILGESAGIEEVRQLVRQFAPRDVKVLVTGETGVGKEVVATALWKGSRRADKPFVVVNASAVPESLVESELFGHRKGAFTGASQEQTGKIELAHGGTLFLDEVGDLPLAAQSKLLRFLESGEIQKVGAERVRTVDVRVVAATSRDLEVETAKGRFRADLYYRLNVGRIHVPPLRERLVDVPLLFLHFLVRICSKSHENPPALNSDALAALQKHSWPGNVRELRNVAERVLALCGSEIDLRVVESILGSRAEPARRERGESEAGGAAEFFAEMPDGRWPPWKEARDRFEKAYLARVLEESGDNVSRAAVLSGLERSHFHQKLVKLGVVRQRGK